MKKLFAILLTICLLLCGCTQPSVPFTENTSDQITVEPEYHYVYPDDKALTLYWTNNTTEKIYMLKTYNLEMLSGDSWVIVGNSEKADFDTSFSFMTSPGNTSNVTYDFRVYTDSLKEGNTYRISTFCFDDKGNEYQVFAEFICDAGLADEETKAKIEADQNGEFRKYTPKEGEKVIHLG